MMGLITIIANGIRLDSSLYLLFLMTFYVSQSYLCKRYHLDKISNGVSTTPQAGQSLLDTI